MASRSAHGDGDKVDIDELLEHVGKTLDRVKALYEQFFLGHQKQPPAHLHTDLERKLRDLQQMQVRNTGLRYRLATLQQKYGSYNTYWRRTLRQIENGTYVRNLSKIGRRAAQTGEEIPEEILAAMPKRMREQVRRDREAALAVARRRADGRADLQRASDDTDDDEITAVIGGAPDVPRQVTRGGAFVLSEDDGDLDIDAFFAAVTREEPAPAPAPVAAPPPAPPPAPAPAPVAAPRTAPPPQAAAPSQGTRPIPVAPGASRARAPVPVESMAGPFPRHTPPPAASSRPPPPRPPPGMNEADVNALYARYVQAKQAVGEPAGPGTYGKLLQTLNAQAPKIMQQYKAKGVEFTVVVKDNQVVLRARPKT